MYKQSQLETPPSLFSQHSSHEKDEGAIDAERSTKSRKEKENPIITHKTKTMTTTFIRPRHQADLPSCASLLARVYERDGYPVQGVSHAVEFLSSPSTLAAWVAEEVTIATIDNTNMKATQPAQLPAKILGHVSLARPSPHSTDPAVLLWRSQHQSSSQLPPSPIAGIADVLVLERLFVDPSARGQGLAAQLLRAASEEAGRLGLRVVLFALVKDAGAMRLYERVGWREFGREMYGYRDGEGREAEMEAVCFVGPGHSS